MRSSLVVLFSLFASVLCARTFDITVWRGETYAARLPDFCEIGETPAGLTIRRGTLMNVEYAPKPNSLERLIKKDRVVWDGFSSGARVVEVIVPESTAPGCYECGTMRVHVIDRILPQPAKWRYYLDLWQHPWAVARIAGVKPFSPEHYAAMRPVYELLASAGQKTITISLLDEPWDHQCYDAYHSMFEDDDFKLFDEYVEFALSCGLGPDISCYSLCPWKLKEKPGTEAFEARWGSFLAKFAAHLKAKGWYERTTMSMDERAPDQVKAVVDFVHRYAPGMRIAMAGNRKPSDFDGIRIDSYSQLLNYVDKPFIAECAKRRAEGLLTTMYICCAPLYPNTFMSSSEAEAFWIGAAPAAFGLDGLLRWAWNSWPYDPARDATFGNWASGDTFLCYPNGEPSWRFLELRNGIVAAEKIRLLKESGRDCSQFGALYEVGKAISGKADFKAVKEKTLEFVNRE